MGGIRRLILSAFVLAWSVAVSSPCRADAALEDRLRSEAPKAWEQIVELARHLEVKVVDTRSSPGSDKVTKSEWMYKTNGENALQELVAEATRSGRAMARNARYAFKLRKSAPSRPWFVYYVGTNLGDVREEIRNDGLDYVSQVQLYLAGDYLPDLLKSPNFKIESVEPVTRRMEELAAVTFRYAPEADARSRLWPSLGVVYLNPQRLWAAEEFDVEVAYNDGQTQKWTQTVEFRPEPQHTPLPLKRVENRGPTKSDPSESIWTWEYVDCKSRDIPDEEFTLTAFGLPEISPPASGKSRFWVALSAAGVLCIIIGMLLRRTSTRS